MFFPEFLEETKKSPPTLFINFISLPNHELTWDYYLQAFQSIESKTSHIPFYVYYLCHDEWLESFELICNKYKTLFLNYWFERIHANCLQSEFIRLMSTCHYYILSNTFLSWKLGQQVTYGRSGLDYQQSVVYIPGYWYSRGPFIRNPCPYPIPCTWKKIYTSLRI